MMGVGGDFRRASMCVCVCVFFFFFGGGFSWLQGWVFRLLDLLHLTFREFVCTLQAFSWSSGGTQITQSLWMSEFQSLTRGPVLKTPHKP